MRVCCITVGHVRNASIYPVNKQPAQLPLGIRLNDEARFENTLISERNQALVDQLLTQPTLLYVRANPGVGLSHLLQALCHQSNFSNHSALYLPLADRAGFSPEILEGLDSIQLICLDDVDSIAGDADWERGLFNAFNAIAAAGRQLILAGKQAPGNVQFALADLQSRLQLAPVYQLHDLTDNEKKDLLQLRARVRGMNLNPAVADYIVARTERSLGALISVLDQLDASSLSNQRPLTIPLVKDTMNW